MERIRSLTILLAAAALAAASCSDDDKSPEEAGQGIRRTVLMYVAAENSLGYERYNSGDSAEVMAGSRFLDARDQLLMYVDDARNPRVYRFYKGCKEPQIVRQFNENLCSADPETLRDILAWTRQAYHSESYGLVFWSHASGWLPALNTDYPGSRSFGPDTGTGGRMKDDLDRRGRTAPSMDIDSLAWAVEASGIRPEYIFFDACFMQCIEVDYALRNAADYVVACPISTPAIGADYTTLMRRGLFTGRPADIADTFFSYMTELPPSDPYSTFGLVISCVKTSELDGLAAETRRCLSKISASSGDACPDMSGVKCYSLYGSVNSYNFPHFYDLNAAMKKILAPGDYGSWKRQLDKCIEALYLTPRFFADTYGLGEEYFLDTDSDCCGISAFIPQEDYTRNAWRCPLGDLNKAFRDTGWYSAAGWGYTPW